MKGTDILISRKFESQAIWNMVHQCPRLMMLREFVQNGIEGASLAAPGNRIVEVRQVPIKRVPKLAIWNTGPGMGPDALSRLTNLHESGAEKTMGLIGNFGLGAKVAGLASNPVGSSIGPARTGWSPR